MNAKKRAKLRARGWSVAAAAQFLELLPEESALVETKIALSQALRRKRAASHLTQAELATRLKSSQSRVAKMEAGDRSVSVDLILRGLYALGTRPREVGRMLERA